MSDARVPFARPAPLPLSRVQEYYRLSEESGWYTRGPCNRLLAERAAALGGAGWHGIPLSSGTVALAVLLRALALGDGPRLAALPSFTCPAVAAAAVWAGLEPLFVDVDAGHWHLSPRALEEAVHRRAGEVAAVVAVANFGTDPGEEVVAAWRDAAGGIPLVLDAAAGLGAVPPAADATIYSFEAAKPAGMGEGALLLTPHEETAARVRRLAYYGLEDKVAVEPGINGKVSELSAAALLCRLDEVDDLVAERQRRGAEIVRRSAGQVAFQSGHARSAWQTTQVLFPTAKARGQAIERAQEVGVEWKTLWEPPLHAHPAFAACEREPLPVTEDLAAQSLSLPMTSDLSADEIDRIVTVIGS